MRDAIYKGNIYQKLREIMDGHLSNLLRLFKNEKKTDSFAAHFEQNFNATTSRTDLHKYIAFKVVKQLNPIGAMKMFTKPNCNL